jgi:hypothetical protein
VIEIKGITEYNLIGAMESFHSGTDISVNI